MVKFTLVASIVVSIDQLPINYTCNQTDDHEHTDDDQGKKLGSVFLPENPQKYPNPQSQVCAIGGK